MASEHVRLPRVRTNRSRGRFLPESKESIRISRWKKVSTRQQEDEFDYEVLYDDDGRESGAEHDS